MKFIVSSSVLLKKLTNISGVIASNPTNPLLESFKFDITPNKIKATATDNQTTMSIDIEIQGKETAVICIEAKILLDLLKNLSEQPLTFDINLENYFIEFTSNEGKYSLSGESAQMFPKLSVPEGAKNFQLRSSQLLAAINNTLFVVPQDELRPNMSGVYFEMAKDNITFVSTDAHRLIRYTLADAKCPDDHGVIVPKKPLTILKGALVNNDALITLSYTKSHLYVTQDDLELACLLVNAKFPDYKMVLPTNNPYTLTVNRAEFLSAMRRVAVFANKTTNQMILKINGSELRLFAQDVDFAHEGNERMPCKYNGEDMDIAFNAKLFVELLNTLSSEEIHMDLSTPSKAGLIKPSDVADGEDILMLLMPLMIN
jgi:DNA polymerase III subunit beta